MRALLLSTLLAATLVAGGAHATPNFPGAIQRQLSATAPPACRVCHVDGITGLGTVNTPFGKNMRERGLEAYDEPRLVTALAAMERDRIDSSKGRGTTDIEALRRGGDPNSTSAGSALGEPDYGCGATFARRTTGSWTALAALAVATLSALRRGRGARGSAARRSPSPRPPSGTSARRAP